MDDTLGYVEDKHVNHFNCLSVLGYTTTKPSQFDLQDGGSAVAVDALAALFGLFGRSLFHQVSFDFI